MLPKSDGKEDNEQHEHRNSAMTNQRTIPDPIDILEIEREARRLRAEALSSALRRFGAWLRRRPLPQAETA